LQHVLLRPVLCSSVLKESRRPSPIRSGHPNYLRVRIRFRFLKRTHRSGRCLRACGRRRAIRCSPPCRRLGRRDLTARLRPHREAQRCCRRPETIVECNQRSLLGTFPAPDQRRSKLCGIRRSKNVGIRKIFRARPHLFVRQDFVPTGAKLRKPPDGLRSFFSREPLLPNQSSEQRELEPVDELDASDRSVATRV